jgi:hypothetical protein
VTNVPPQAKLCKARHFKHVRELTDEIWRLGGEQIRVQVTSGNHIRIAWCIGDRQYLVFIGSTPSCHHAAANARAEIRRKFRGGVA